MMPSIRDPALFIACSVVSIIERTGSAQSTITAGSETFLWIRLSLTATELAIKGPGGRQIEVDRVCCSVEDCQGYALPARISG